MKRQAVFVLVLIVSIFCSVRGWSQRTQTTGHPGQIRGQIRLPDNAAVPAGTLVSLEMRGGGIGGQTETDPQGKFEFRQVAPGFYEVHVKISGFLPESQYVDLTGTPTAFLTFTLKPDLSRKEVAVPPGGPRETISALDPNVPDDARKDLESGRALLSEGKHLDESVKFFKKAITRYPQYSEAYLLMGAAYSSQAKWDDAEKALQKTVELNKNIGSAYIALGAVENEKKAYGDAEKSLLKAVELSPESPDAHFELGRAYWGLQRWDVADQHVSKANQLRPNNAGQHVMMGNILLRERDAMGALKEFKQAVQLEPQGPLAAPSQQMVDKIEAALKQAANQKK